ncbi:MAG: HAD family hydrolase [Deltaproteobacteria bacterium]|nr:HAD family hydrolase [Deltaproteobacteria bacterium]MBW2419666.1 HAD family hydrolase [Deltaproteobacteria bacterium]
MVTEMAPAAAGLPVRALLFDLFDTLVDLYMEKLPHFRHRGLALPASARAIHAALPTRAGIDFDTFARALGQLDAQFLVSHYKKDIELPSVQRFSTLSARLGLPDEGLPEILAQVHMDLLREEVAMPLHHLELLATLGRRVRIGVCSNFSHSRAATGILEDYGLDDHLAAVVVSEDIGLRKPRGEIFLAALEALGVGPEETLHVGDNLAADVTGAAALGIRTVWVTRRVSDPEELLTRHAGPRPDYRIADLNELPGILDEVGTA